jgi:hypothetical protein
VLDYQNSVLKRFRQAMRSLCRRRLAAAGCISVGPDAGALVDEGCNFLNTLFLVFPGRQRFPDMGLQNQNVYYEFLNHENLLRKPNYFVLPPFINIRYFRFVKQTEEVFQNGVSYIEGVDIWPNCSSFSVRHEAAVRR